jgi:hypothetical protein
LEDPTIAFHGKRPVTPYRPECPDTIRNVQKGVNCERASRKPLDLVLIVYPGYGMNTMAAIAMHNRYSLLVVLNPFNEASSNNLYLLACDFELEAKIEKVNQSNKVSIIFGTLEAPA